MEPPIQQPKARAPMRTATLTIQSIRGPGTLTIRASMLDETSVPFSEHAVTLAVGACSPRSVMQALDSMLPPLAEKCEDLGWRELTDEGRGDLRRWTEHSVLARLLQLVQLGITVELAGGRPDDPSVRTGDGERPVELVDRQG